MIFVDAALFTLTTPAPLDTFEAPFFGGVVSSEAAVLASLGGERQDNKRSFGTSHETAFGFSAPVI